MGIGWKNERGWKPYFRRMSNKELLATAKHQKEGNVSYKGTVLPKVAREEIARRKKNGTMRQDAGKKKPHSGFGGMGAFGLKPIRW